jgi:hypothetical protein
VIAGPFFVVTAESQESAPPLAPRVSHKADEGWRTSCATGVKYSFEEWLCRE